MDWKEIYKKLPEMTYEENSELIRSACARNITLSCPDGQRTLASGEDVGPALIEKFFSTAKDLDGTPLMSEEAAGAIQDMLANMDAGGQEPPGESLFHLPGDEFLRQVHEAAQRSFDDAMEGHVERLRSRKLWDNSTGANRKMGVTLYHGTTPEKAASLLKSPIAKDRELWLANDPGIARSYGPCVLMVTVPSSAKLDAYPLRSGCLEPMESFYQEPAEFLMYHEGPLYIRLFDTPHA